MKQRIPARIRRLQDMARNLWWSWHVEGRNVFRALDYQALRLSGYNPVKQLLSLSQEKLESAASDPAFLAEYDAAVSAFYDDLSFKKGWVAEEHPDLLSKTIAYFSAEFALHSSLPIYAGGLGVLAGDVLKEASDLGLPLVGVGFMYPQGYFVQHISADGWQQENYAQLNFEEAPLTPVVTPEGKRVIARVDINDRVVGIGVWLVQVGRVNLYLMDTNLEENSPGDRQLSARLYTADREQRLQQEIILGIGGVRVLRALNIEPAVWHANEGHTAFMTLERIREQMANGVPFDEAAQRVQSTTVFTTHTPVPAGHDIFPVELMDKYFRNFWNSLKIDREAFLKLGQPPGADSQSFNMTILALKMSQHRNAVSKLHSKVARRMWQGLWPDLKEEKVPIIPVTNGVHLPTWIAPELYEVFQKYIGGNVLTWCDNVERWKRILDIPDSELWEVRQTLRRKLIHVILEHAQEKWADGAVNAQQVLAMGALLDSDTLTIGFARRFTEYKRPALIFHDIERLKRIIKDTWRPVQFVFAGKSHPADFASKHILHHVYSLAIDKEFHGRIAFVEDYDMLLARYLVQGVDVWLNTPRRLQEACGTSGMKASANGVLHLSVRDGWWQEGYNGKNGWAIGDGPYESTEQQDAQDAESIYRLLEEEIVPLFYERDVNGIPRGWMKMVKEAISSITPQFCAKRMMKEYTEKTYLPIIKANRKR
jgi:starch phosphorylase